MNTLDLVRDFRAAVGRCPEKQGPIELLQSPPLRPDSTLLLGLDIGQAVESHYGPIDNDEVADAWDQIVNAGLKGIPRIQGHLGACIPPGPRHIAFYRFTQGLLALPNDTSSARGVTRWRHKGVLRSAEGPWLRSGDKVLKLAPGYDSVTVASCQLVPQRYTRIFPALSGLREYHVDLTGNKNGTNLLYRLIAESGLTTEAYNILRS